MINIGGKLTAKTMEGILAESNEIAYHEEDKSLNGNTVADKLTNLSKQFHERQQEWKFYGIAIDSKRGVLKIGGNMYKLISYEGEAEFDEYIDTSAFVDNVNKIDNPEYQMVITDADNKVLYAKYADGTETDIDLSGYTIINPTTGEMADLTKIINVLKRVNN